MNEKILPTILMIIDICASIPYGMQGDWRSGETEPDCCCWMED